MVALALFDAVLSSDKDSDRSARVAEELIQFALDDIKHIEKLDNAILTLDASEFDRHGVALVRGCMKNGPVRPKPCWIASSPSI